MKRQLQCPHCEKQFNFEIELKNHVDHKHELKLLCDQCEFKTYRKYTLYKHTLIHHMDKKEHICNICGLSFKLATYLRNHQVVHSDERNFKCDECGKGLKSTFLPFPYLVLCREQISKFSTKLHVFLLQHSRLSSC